jgi:carbon monoxide dehydrogenase subunit G
LELKGERLLPADQATAWSALTDAELLRQCIPGAESISALDGNRWEILMTAAIGPVRARFKGTLEMADIAAPESYTLKFDGSGGQAGFARGKAAVKLTPAGAQQTTLAYAAQAQVGGKLAQVGSRIVDAAAAATADKFFEAFAAQLTARVAAAREAAGAAPTQVGAPVRAGWWAVVRAFLRRLFG